MVIQANNQWAYLHLHQAAAAVEVTTGYLVHMAAAVPIVVTVTAVEVVAAVEVAGAAVAADSMAPQVTEGQAVELPTRDRLAITSFLLPVD